jgi:hypothetical protein
LGFAVIVDVDVVVVELGVLVEVEVVLDTFASTVPVTSTLCPTWFFSSLSFPLRTYEVPVVADDELAAPLVPVGVPAAVPACVGDGAGLVAPSVDPGVAAALDVEVLPVMAFVSRNPFSVEPLADDELMFCTQPVTVIVLSAADVALAPL